MSTIMLDWEDVSDHHNFIKSDQYPGFLAKAAEIFDFEAQKPYIGNFLLGIKSHFTVSDQ